MGSFFFKLLIGMMILPFVSLLAGGITYPEDLIYKVVFLLGFGIAVVLHEGILSFLTVPKVFLTRIISIGILITGYLFLADLVLPGVVISSLTIGDMDLGFANISEMELSKYVTMGLLAISSGITYYLVMKLKSK